MKVEVPLKSADDFKTIVSEMLLLTEIHFVYPGSLKIVQNLKYIEKTLLKVWRTTLLQFLNRFFNGKIRLLKK